MCHNLALHQFRGRLLCGIKRLSGAGVQRQLLLPVFEGLIPLVVGSGRGEMNQRFGQPSTPARPSAGRSFPFHDTLQTDPDLGRTDGLLARLDAADKTPKSC